MLSEPLLYLFQLSLEKGVFPDNLKIAKVTPIYKTGDSSDISNYMPISVLPGFSKILLPEKVKIKKKIIKKKHFERSEYTRGVFIDLSKAFDTVDHNIQLNKIRSLKLLKQQEIV